MIITVTNRDLCKGDFLEQVERVAQGNPNAILLREKDLSEMEYQNLAVRCGEICKQYQVSLIAHHFTGAAERAGISKIHLPYDDFLQHWNKLSSFVEVGVSVHSVEEAVFAAKQGASYLIAGHIFSTDCKKGITPRGLSFLADICGAVVIPVFAIGGISCENVYSTIQHGAAGFCVMSQLMDCDRPYLKISNYRKALLEPVVVDQNK